MKHKLINSIMDIQNKEPGDRSEKQTNRKISIILFMTSVILFCVFIVELFKSSQDMTGNLLAPGLFASIILILSLIMAGMSLSSFFRYKLNKESVSLKNISAKVALGIILVVLFFFWRLIIFTASRNLVSMVQLSITEWVIVVIGILLIALGIFRKSK